MIPKQEIKIQENCKLCGMLTFNTVRDYDVCEPCEGKFGTWEKIEDELERLGKLKELIDTREEKEEDSKVFECSLSYSGGTKEDIIHLICTIMDNNDVSLDEVEGGMF